MLTTTKIALDRIATPWMTGKSRCSTACTVSSPMPGIVEDVFDDQHAAEQGADLDAEQVEDRRWWHCAARAALGSAWGGRPRTAASSTKFCRSVSATETDSARMNNGDISTAITSAGRIV